MTPLRPARFTPLPLGSIRPEGWLLDQLRVQANGLTGHLDEFWPSIARSRWIGGDQEGWERGPYWLDGLIPLAVLLDDAGLLAKARRWIDHILAHQHDDGWLGEKVDSHEGEGLNELDPWPLFVLFKAFLQWHEATGDERIPPALLRCAARVHQLLRTSPLRSWARMRWADLVLSLHRLHILTGAPFLLELAELAAQQGYDWNRHFDDLPSKEKTRHDQLGPEVGLIVHGVNNAMAVKTGAVRWRQSGQAADAAAPRRALESLDRYHGAPTGMFYADEHLAGRSPSQGYETCSVVEMMFSLETAGAILGDPILFDRLEAVAYNALAASCRADMWAHQYHQQTNQIRCSLADHEWTDAWHHANIFGQDTQFRCCQANLHQGWPKLTASLWMTEGDALVAAAYAPCSAQTERRGTPITLRTLTNYPFHNRIRIEIHPAAPVRFPLMLRIPAWSAKSSVSCNGGAPEPVAAGTFHAIDREWREGDAIELEFCHEPRFEPRTTHSTSVWIGPLLMALPVEERWEPIPNAYEHLEPRARDWEVHPESDWNYALESTAHGPVRFTPPGHPPFARANAPVTLETTGRRVPAWQEINHSAAPPPPGGSDAPVESLRLIPYGCARLRIAEFPVAAQK